jgi:hypothetical protein
MVPLAALPFVAAAAVFTLLSVAAFAATVADWLPRALPGGTTRVRRARALLALGAGLYPPIGGSVLAGQANLLVVALLGWALAPFVPIRGEGGTSGAHRLPSTTRVRALAGGAALGLAAIVKLAPLALAVPLALAALSFPAAAATLAGLVLGVGASLGLAALLAPASFAGSSGLAALFGPDAFWTNQSINGAISRLFLAGDRTSPALTGDPVPWIVGLTVALALLTGAVLLRTLAPRARPTVRGVALGLAVSIVAAAVGAPKNSFWNHAPVILALGLALAAGHVAARRFRRALVAIWLVATVAEVAVDRTLAIATEPATPLLTIASDSATFALVALWAALAGALLDGAPLHAAPRGGSDSDGARPRPERREAS